jgi:hypothetical protein
MSPDEAAGLETKVAWVSSLPCVILRYADALPIRHRGGGLVAFSASRRSKFEAI